MENLGPRQIFLNLTVPPCVLFEPKHRYFCSEKDVTPIFTPYAESLPLQSGSYMFVIDREGNFRVKWGVSRKHGPMVGCQRRYSPT
jgi:hypothetical protein